MKSLLFWLLFILLIGGISSSSASQTDPSSPLGINGLGFFHSRNNPRVFEEKIPYLQRMKAIGVEWDRFDFWWGVIEPEPGRFEWAFPDQVIDFYARYHIQMLPILCYHSNWSSGQAPADEEERQRFANYVYQVVSRYKDRVHFWEIWNEPNIPTFWKPKPNPRQYALLLKSAYASAKRADPKAKIIGGVTSMADINFLEAIYQAGAWDSMDIVSIHPYSFGGSPTEQRLDLILNTLHNFMRKIGKPKPVWITEIGYIARTPNEEGIQASNLIQAYAIALSHQVQKVFWFCLTDWEEKWGILKVGGQPKKAYRAYRLLTHYLKGARFVGYLPSSGDWRDWRQVWQKGREVFLLLWTAGPQQRIKIRGPALKITTFSRSQTYSQKEVWVEYGSEPLFLTGVSPHYLREALKQRPLKPKQNLLVNGDLQSKEGEIYGWNKGRHEGTGKEGTFFFQPGMLCLSNAKDACWDSLPVPVIPGQRLTLSAEILAQKATGENSIALYFWDSLGWGYLGHCQGPSLTGNSSRWQRIKISAPVPPKAYYVRVDLVSRRNQGKVCFRKIKLQKDSPR